MEELYKFLVPGEVVEGAFENLWVQGRYGFTGCVTNRRVLFVGTTRGVGHMREKVVDIPLTAISNFKVEIKKGDMRLFVAGAILVGVGILFSLLVPQFIPAGVVYAAVGVGCVALSKKLRKRYLLIESKGLILRVEGTGRVAEEMAAALRRAYEKARSTAVQG